MFAIFHRGECSFSKKKLIKKSEIRFATDERRKKKFQVKLISISRMIATALTDEDEKNILSSFDNDSHLKAEVRDEQHQ